jgi:putative FmdB family regulatory protein
VQVSAQAGVQAIISLCFCGRCPHFPGIHLNLEGIFVPIYGYQCEACGHIFELMQKMSDPAPTACPSCGKPDLRKQLSAAGFQLKGGGWYATDFKGGGDKGGGDKGGASQDSGDSGPSAAGCGSGACGNCAN